MYCRNCGKELNEETRFCPACGSRQYGEGNQSHQTYDDPFTTSTVTNEIEDDKPAKCWSVFAMIGKILGIVAIAICWLPMYGVIAGVPGIVFSCLGRKAIDEDAIRNRTIGLKLAIAGTVVSFVVFVIYLILVGAGLISGLMGILEGAY